MPVLSCIIITAIQYRSTSCYLGYSVFRGEYIAHKIAYRFCSQSGYVSNSLQLTLNPARDKEWTIFKLVWISFTIILRCRFLIHKRFFLTHKYYVNEQPEWDAIHSLPVFLHMVKSD